MGAILGKIYLERALSKLGIASRTQTRQWIKEGKLKVNGKIIKDPLFLVTSEKDIIEHDGKVLQAQKRCVVLLHKPKGYVTTKSDEKGRYTVYDLLPSELHHVHPVGRLDMNTTGLLLLTNDTTFSSQLTDPSNAIARVYIATVEGKITDEDAAKIKKGIKDDGEILRAQEVILRKISNRESHLTVTLTQGKNREIRRIFKAIGHEIITLKRVAFGQWQLENLEVGKWRMM